jgi:hypothetical protein
MVLAVAEADPLPSWEAVLARMRAFTVQELHHATGLSERLLRYYVAGQSRPKGTRLTVLLTGLEALEASQTT